MSGSRPRLIRRATATAFHLYLSSNSKSYPAQISHFHQLATRIENKTRPKSSRSAYLSSFNANMQSHLTMQSSSPQDLKEYGSSSKKICDIEPDHSYLPGNHRDSYVITTSRLDKTAVLQNGCKRHKLGYHRSSVACGKSFCQSARNRISE